MGTMCQEAALHLHEICKRESVEADPDETILAIETVLQELMFRADYCSPRCESTECRRE